MNNSDKLTAWKAFVSNHTSYGQEANFAEERIFKYAENFLKLRIGDISRGVHGERTGFSVDFYSTILAFDFSGEEPIEYRMKKREVTKAFKEFLLAGAVFAKKNGLDAYSKWCQVLLKFEFTYKNFRHGLDDDEMSKFMDEVEYVASLTHVEREVLEKGK